MIITVIIPLLNGVDIVERIRAILDKGIVLPACLYLGTHIESPGVINQSGGNGIIIFGPDPKYPEYSGENVKAFFQKTGIKYEWYDDPLPKIWEKYMFIAAFGLVTALYRRIPRSRDGKCRTPKYGERHIGRNLRYCQKEKH